MQTLDQKYAAKAYEQVSAIYKEDGYKKYGAMAHKLPILIYSAGLIQALEFVNSRGAPIQRRLLDHLAETVIGEDNNRDTLLQTARSAQLSGYIRLTRQILAALLWYKRFAQSILDVDVTEAAQTETDETTEGDGARQ